MYHRFQFNVNHSLANLSQLDRLTDFSPTGSSRRCNHQTSLVQFFLSILTFFNQLTVLCMLHIMTVQ